jgi:hypothetical protein
MSIRSQPAPAVHEALNIRRRGVDWLQMIEQDVEECQVLHGEPPDQKPHTQLRHPSNISTKLSSTSHMQVTGNEAFVVTYRLSASFNASWENL